MNSRQKYIIYIFIHFEINKQITQQMILYYYDQIIFIIMITIIIITLLFLIYITLRYYILPKCLYFHYSRQLKSKGYKVYQIPFRPFSAPYFQKYNENLLKYGDSLHTQKHQFHNYDVILSNVLDTVCLTLQNLDLVKQFYSPQNIYRLPKHPSLSQGIKLSLGYGIMFSQGETWKRKRKIISKSFNYQLLLGNIKTISQITDQTLAQLQTQSYLNSYYYQHQHQHQHQQQQLHQQNSYQFQPRDIGFRVFSRVMMRCFFQCEFEGNKIGGVQTHQFLQGLFDQVNKQSDNLMIILMGKWAYSWGLTKDHRRLKAKVNVFQRQIMKLIDKKVCEYKQRNQKYKSTSLQTHDQSQQQQHPHLHPQLSNQTSNLIYKLLQQTQNGQQSYNLQQLLQQFCTFLIVGTDTTTNFLRTTLYYLSKNQTILKRVRDEIEKYVKCDEDVENVEILKKLNYLDCLQHEVVRMAGPSATCFIRLAAEDMRLGNVDVRKGTGVFVEPTGNHYNPAYFTNPFTFNPDRWLSDKSFIPPFAFTGFFGGPRTCIGKHLSYLQSKIVLIKILRRYHKLQITAGGERMQVRFLYGPERFYMRFDAKDNPDYQDQLYMQSL